MLADEFFLFGLGQHALCRARFVDHVYGLVRQVAVGDEARGKLGGAGQSGGTILDTVMGSKRSLSPFNISMVCSTLGSVTSTFWKRRDSA